MPPQKELGSVVVTQLKIPDAVVLPDAKAKMLYGIEPTVFTREDMSSSYSWYKFVVKHDPWLDRRDFINDDTFYKYYLLSLGLLEYPIVIIGGPKGAGKSLVMGFLTYQISRLFKKQVVLDWTPPRPDKFGKFIPLNDEDIVDKIQLEINRLEKIEKEMKMQGLGKLPRELLEKLIVFNTIMGLDEGDKWAPSDFRTNTTRLISRIANRARHIYLGLLMVYIRPERADPLIKEAVTHTITCGHDWFPALPGWCSYQIRDVRDNGTGLVKWLHLDPADHTDIWDSFNLPGLSHNLAPQLHGKQKEPKLLKEMN